MMMMMMMMIDGDNDGHDGIDVDDDDFYITICNSNSVVSSDKFLLLCSFECNTTNRRHIS
jgi:hypothetical protein